VFFHPPPPNSQNLKPKRAEFAGTKSKNEIGHSMQNSIYFLRNFGLVEFESNVYIRKSTSSVKLFLSTGAMYRPKITTEMSCHRVRASHESVSSRTSQFSDYSEKNISDLKPFQKKKLDCIRIRV